MADESQVDPYRWKPLFGLIPLLLAVIPLAFIEAQLVKEVCAGNTNVLIQAALIGVLLVSLTYVLALGLWRWWHRPVGEAVIMQAATQVASLLPEAPMAFRPRGTKPPNKWVYLALPLACLSVSIFGFAVGDMVLGWVALGAAVAFGGLLGYLFVDAKRTSRLVLQIDPQRRVVIFENFTFTTHFFPNKPSSREEIAFDGILDCTYIPGHKGGPASLSIRTIRGKTGVNSRIQGFETIHRLLENLVILNLADAEQHQVNLRREPKIATPWYGWLTIAIALVGLAALIRLLTNL